MTRPPLPFCYAKKPKWPFGRLFRLPWNCNGKLPFSQRTDLWAFPGNNTNCLASHARLIPPSHGDTGHSPSSWWMSFHSLTPFHQQQGKKKKKPPERKTSICCFWIIHQARHFFVLFLCRSESLLPPLINMYMASFPFGKSIRTIMVGKAARNRVIYDYEMALPIAISAQLHFSV